MFVHTPMEKGNNGQRDSRGSVVVSVVTSSGMTMTTSLTLCLPVSVCAGSEYSRGMARPPRQQTRGEVKVKHGGKRGIIQP